MNKAKADFHMHTRYSDGWKTPNEVQEILKRRKYDIISVTDHNEIRGSIKIYENQQNENQFIVVPGIEIFFKDIIGLSELLAYFRNPQDLEEFFKKEIEPNKSLLIGTIPTPLDKLTKKISEYGGIIGIPHGLTKKGVLSKHKFEDIENVKIVESYNAMTSMKMNTLLNNFIMNNNALNNRKKELILISSSDYHGIEKSLETKTTILSIDNITLNGLFDNFENKNSNYKFFPYLGRSMNLNDRIKHHVTSAFYHLKGYKPKE